MVIDATEQFAQRTAALMFTLPREEMEQRLDLFKKEHVLLIVRTAKAMAGK